MDKFKVYRLREVEKKVVAAFEQSSIDDLDPGEVTVRVAYSCVNYKDALAATGAGRIIRRFPCVGGIDLSGTVVESSDARFILTTGETGGPEVKAQRGDSHDHAAGSTPLASRARARLCSAHCGRCVRGRPEELVPFCRMFFACASSRDGRSVNFFSISCKGSAESRKRKAVRRGL